MQIPVVGTLEVSSLELHSLSLCTCMTTYNHEGKESMQKKKIDRQFLITMTEKYYKSNFTYYSFGKENIILDFIYQVIILLMHFPSS